MSMLYITFRSITPAQRAQRTLRQGGITAQLQRTPRYLAKQGCGYCLRLPEAQRDMALAILDRVGAQYEKVVSPGEGMG